MTSSSQWIEVLRRWVDRCVDDPLLTNLGTASDFTFCLWSGANTAWLRVREGQVLEWEASPTFHHSWDFTLSVPLEVWERFLQPVPPPTFHDLFAPLARVPEFRIEGSREAFAQHAHVMRRLLELWRLSVNDLPGVDVAAPMRNGIEPIVGRYIHLDVLGTTYRV